MKKRNSDKAVGTRIVYMVISLLVAILLWTYVEYVEQPDVEQTISWIPVEFTGEDTLAAKNLVMTNGDETYVTVTIRGTRSVVSKVTAEDITVTADLSTINSSGDYQRGYSISFAPDIDTRSVTVVSHNPSTVLVHISDIVSREIPVYGAIEGDTDENHTVGDLTLSPSKITVTGAQDLIDSISFASVAIEIDGATENIEKDARFNLIDTDGNVIDSDNITTDTLTVHVVLPILSQKSVPLSVNLIEGGGMHDGNVVADIEPAEITISGSKDVIDKIESISLGNVDLGTVSTEIEEFTFEIPAPEGTEIISDEKTAKVTITPNEGIVAQEHLFETVEITGVPDGFSAEIKSVPLSVVLRGSEDSLAAVTDENVRAVVDLSGITDPEEGTEEAEVSVIFDGVDDVGVVGTYTVTVELTRTGEKTTTDTDSTN